MPSGPAAYGLESPALVLNVQRQGGEAVEYRLGKRETENDYVLKASSRPEYFRLPGYAGEALIKAAKREQLVAAAADAANDGAGSTDATGSPPAEGPDESGQSAAQE